MKNPFKVNKESVTGTTLQYIAFWQFLCFFLLICVVWANEVLNLESAVYGVEPSEADWVESSLLTALVIIVGFITIAQTFVQQRRALQGMFIICSYCHKVRLDKDAWQRLDTFVSDKTRTEFSHGICPACYEKTLAEGQVAIDDVAGDTTSAADSEG